MPLTIFGTEIFLRLAAAFLAGALLGLERETHGRPAGLRTTVLACVSAAMAMVLSEHFALTYNMKTDGAVHSDPGRLAAGVLTGIGFLGAGTIFRAGSMVRGVTTAALLWYATVLGLVFGSGQWLLGGAGFVLAVVTLGLLPLLESRISRNAYAVVAITKHDPPVDLKQLQDIFNGFGIEITDIAFIHNVERKRSTSRFDVKFKKGQVLEMSQPLLAEIEALPGVLDVRWNNRYTGSEHDGS